MNIELIRNHRTRWALDGELRIGGQKICDTSENLMHHLVQGTYSILIDRCHHYRRKMPIVLLDESSKVGPLNPFEPLNPRCHSCKKKSIGSQHANLPCYCPQIKIGNGVANRTDGSIIIGQLRLPGLMLKSSDHYDRLIDRLDKAAQRGESITLTIK